MNRCLLACCFLAALTMASAPATGADGLDQLMQSLAARRHAEASFVEQQFLSLLKRPVESFGELAYDAPSRLEKRTLGPHPEDLLLQGETLTLRRGNRTRVLDLSSHPQVLPFVEGLRATLAGDRIALERMFRLDFAGDRARWSLELTPKEPSIAKLVALITIDGAAAELLRVEIRQADGDRSLMTLRAHADR